MNWKRPRTYYVQFQARKSFAKFHRRWKTFAKGKNFCAALRNHTFGINDNPKTFLPCTFDFIPVKNFALKIWLHKTSVWACPRRKRQSFAMPFSSASFPSGLSRTCGIGATHYAASGKPARQLTQAKPLWRVLPKSQKTVLPLLCETFTPILLFVLSPFGMFHSDQYLCSESHERSQIFQNSIRTNTWPPAK